MAISDIKKSGIFALATSDIKKRLTQYGLDGLSDILKDTKSVIAGSFPLQCIVGETWLDSNIDIFCKHLIASEILEEYIESIPRTEYIEIISKQWFFGNSRIINYMINHNDNKIIISIITINYYDVVTYLGLSFDINVCCSYFDGDMVFSPVESDKIKNKQANFNMNSRVYIPKPETGANIQEVYIQHKNLRHAKYIDRGFTINDESLELPKDLHHPPLYMDEQCKIPSDIQNNIMNKLSDYNLSGIEDLFNSVNGMLITGDFLLNCTLDEHWNNTIIKLYYNGINFPYEILAFFTKRGYHHKSSSGPDKNIFYMPDPQYEKVPSIIHTDKNFPIIYVDRNYDIDNSMMCQSLGLDLEKICYDGKNIYSYTPWSRIQNRIGFHRSDLQFNTEFNECIEKYKDRNISITNNKYNIASMTKSSLKR